ncbi:MAG: MFS transporter [Negativicutes bacterium]|nr:MFS transporter [Negativicutes bacterium]
MLKKVIVSSMIGSIVERYDLSLYVAMAGIVFNKHYFPANDATLALIMAFMTVAIGHIARPFGGLLFGHFGDKIGRKTMLLFSLILTGGATVAIGLLPVYDSIGIIAPILLCMFRFLQGFGLGGEWGGAALMVFEHAPEHKGLYGSILQTSLPIGLCLASGVITIIIGLTSQEAFVAWGWRISFLLSAVLVFIGIWIRLSIKETPAFEKIRKSQKTVKTPVIELIENNIKQVILGIMARQIEGVMYSIFGIWIISFLAKNLAVSLNDTLIGITICALTMCACQPFFGWLSDKIGRKQVYMWGSLACGILTCISLLFIQSNPTNIVLLWIAMAIPFGVAYSAIFGIESTLLCEMYPTKVRFTGISIVYHFSTYFCSAPTPIIAVLLYSQFNSLLPVGLFVLLCGFISALAIKLMKNEQEE